MAVSGIKFDFNKIVGWKLKTVFLVVIALLIFSENYYYKLQRTRIYQERKDNLSAIASLKINQIDQWHRGHLGNAEMIKNDGPLIEAIKEYFLNSNQPYINEELSRWMLSLCSKYEYRGVTLIDSNRKVRLVYPASAGFTEIENSVNIDEVLKNRMVVMTDLQKDDSGFVHLDLIVPLIQESGFKASAIGLLILRIDPNKILFPLIQSWPTPSKSSETLIIRKDGDSALFLNNLRNHIGTNLSYRLSLKNKNLLASKAAAGFEGFAEGVDYRNTPVVGFISRVPGFPWYMVAKTDKAELQIIYHRYLYNSLIITVLLIIVIIALFSVWNRDLKIKLYKSQLKSESEIHELEERFSVAFKMSPASITINTMNEYKFLDVNDSFLKDVEYSREEVIGKTPLELNLWINDEERIWIINEIAENRGITGKTINFKTKSGKIKYGLISISLVTFQGHLCILSTLANITENIKAEEKLRQSERLFRKLFENMLNGFAYCKMLDEEGEPLDFMYLNVNNAFESLTGLKDVEGKKASEAIPGIQKSDPELLERYSRVSSTGKPEVFEIFVASMEMWFFISVYSPQKGYFVSVFDVITERKATEERLNHLASIVQSSDDAIIGKSTDGLILSWNKGAQKVYGYEASEVIGKPISILVPADIRDEMPIILKKLSLGESIEHFEAVRLRKDGTILNMSLTISPIIDTNGNIIGASTIGRDFTDRVKTEAALRESEDKFKYIFEHSALGNSISLPTGAVHFNSAFCEMLGYSEEELTKMKWKEFTHPDDFELTQKVIDSLVSRESDSPRFIKRYIRKDGSTLWADVSTSLRYDVSGNPLYFMTTVNDITELKNAEDILRNDEKRLRELIEALPQLFWTCRPDGPCDYLSRQWVEYTGIPENDQLGFGWLGQLHPDDKEATISKWNEMVKAGESFDIEFRIRRYDGEYHWFKTRAIPMRNSDHEIVKWLGSNTDIDTIRKAEAQLVSYNKNLEQSVIQRTEQLESANRELEAFSYSVSHDLRSPLRSVHGFTKILLEDYGKILDNEGKRVCGIILSSASQMSELIDDLLSFSRIGRSTMSPSVLNMNLLATSIFEESIILEKKNNINIKIGNLNNSFGDNNLIKHVWKNLISNAIKYSSKAISPRVTISSRINKNMIEYSVKDNGVGFDMQYAGKLFGVFQRLHGEAEFEGNGVGLAIVQRIVNRHGGKVWAEGEVGKGATFYFTLPVTEVKIEEIKAATL